MLVLRLSPKSFDICNSSAKSKMMQSGCSCRPDSGFMHLDKCKGLLAGQLPEPPQFPPSPHNLSSYQHMDLLETSIREHGYLLNHLLPKQLLKAKPALLSWDPGTSGLPSGHTGHPVLRIPACGFLCLPLLSPDLGRVFPSSR